MYARRCLAPVLLVICSGMALAQSADNSALERELLADADRRASFQAGGTAGHDGSSFFMASADGNYRLEVGGYTQFRYYFNNRDTEGDDEDFSNGFDMTRTALEFGGNVINPQLAYYIRGYFDTAEGGSLDLADAYGSYTFDSGVTVVWGQMIAPITRERLVGDRYQLAVERSVAGGVFDAGYVQGVAASYASDSFRIVGAASDGVNTRNTAYYSPAEADWALTGRGEFKWSGDWDRFQDFTSWRGAEGYAGMLGAAIHWQTHGDTGNTGTFQGIPPTEMDLLQYTADVSLEGDGWNAFGAFVGRSIDMDTGSDADDFGAIIQGGVFVSDQVELFGRWDALLPDDRPAEDSDDDDFHTLTFGGNYYFVAGSHAAKFTADVQWFLDEQSAVHGVTGFRSTDHRTGTLPTDEADQWMVRLQMQLIF